MATMSNEEIFQFLELYQAENCIWNLRSKHHKNKNVVNDAWKRISDTMSVPVHELKKKKESLMSSFRVNLRKKLSSLKSGSGEEDAYKPIWIFYDAMEVFLRDVYESTSIMNSEEDAESHSQQDSQQEAVLDDDTSHNEESNTCSMQTNNNRSEAESSSPFISSQNSNLPSHSKQAQKRRARNPPELQEANKQVATAFSTLNSVLQISQNENEHNKKNEDACDLFSKLLAAQLRDFNKTEQEEIMYDIHGLLINKRRCRDRTIQATSAPFSRPTSSLSSYSQSPSPSQMLSPEALSQNFVHRRASSKSRRIDMQPILSSPAFYSHSPSQILFSRPSPSSLYSSQTLSQNVSRETSSFHGIIQSPELNVPIIRLPDNVEIVSQEALAPTNNAVYEAFERATNNIE